MKLTALRHVCQDGVFYAPGDTFECSDGTAEYLISEHKAALAPAPAIKPVIDNEDGEAA